VCAASFVARGHVASYRVDVGAVLRQPVAALELETVAALDTIRRWGDDRDWRGYDPYDGLGSPFASLLTLGTATGRRLLTQAVKRSPVNLRPALRIAPQWNSKALALVASGYARLAAARGGAELETEAGCWLATLLLRGERGDGLAWGYPFDVQTRFFHYPRETPNAIATSFAIRAFLEGHAQLRHPQWLEAAERASEFLLESMHVVDADVRRYFAYLPAEQGLVHNANALAAAAVVATGRAAGRDDLVTLGLAALRTTVRAQAADGSWPYAEGPHGDWIDNFHTAYVLQAIATCAEDDEELVESLVRGLDFWATSLFDGDRPRYTTASTYPLDAHCYADAIETWVAVEPWRPTAIAAAGRAARALVRDMLDPEGYVVLQRRRHWTNRVPCIRWSTAPSFRSLAGLELLMATGRARLD
jgi:hypothetical protein